MSVEQLNNAELRLLECIRDHDSVRLSLRNILKMANLIGSTTQGLAKAKNHLVALGYATEETSVLTNGDCVVRITDKGRELYGATKNRKKPWWKFW